MPGPVCAQDCIPLDKLIRYYSAKAAVEQEFGIPCNYSTDGAMYRFLGDKRSQLPSMFGKSEETLSIDDAKELALHFYRNWAGVQLCRVRAMASILPLCKE